MSGAEMHKSFVREEWMPPWQGAKLMYEVGRTSQQRKRGGRTWFFGSFAWVVGEEKAVCVDRGSLAKFRGYGKVVRGQNHASLSKITQLFNCTIAHNHLNVLDYMCSWRDFLRILISMVIWRVTQNIWSLTFQFDDISKLRK